MSSMPPYTEEELSRARKHVEALRGFYGHAMIYALVIGGLFIVNHFTGGPWWAFWPALGWGIGLAFHALGVFGKNRLFGREWEERKVREYLDKQRRG